MVCLAGSVRTNFCQNSYTHSNRSLTRSSSAVPDIRSGHRIFPVTQLTAAIAVTNYAARRIFRAPRPPKYGLVSFFSPKPPSASPSIRACSFKYNLFRNTNAVRSVPANVRIIFHVAYAYAYGMVHVVLADRHSPFGSIRFSYVIVVANTTTRVRRSRERNSS